MLPVTGLNDTNEKNNDEKIMENNTNELYQKNNMIYHNVFNEKNIFEKISWIKTNKMVNYQTNTLQPFDKLTNRPILWTIHRQLFFALGFNLR